jgi:hypothetical protein
LHAWVLNDQWNCLGFHERSESIQEESFHGGTGESKLERVRAIVKDKPILLRTMGKHIMEPLGKALSNKVNLQLKIVSSRAHGALHWGIQDWLLDE